MVFGHRTGSRDYYGDNGPARRSLNLVTRLIFAIRQKPVTMIDPDVAFLREAAEAGAKWRAHYEREHQKWLDKGESGIAADELAMIADVDRVTERLNAIADRLMLARD